VLKRVAVFCGSSLGTSTAYAAAARAMGVELAARGINLVYGGGRVGLMGAIADAVLAGGGSAYGVIPEALAKTELAHQGLTALSVVHSMHERKAMMADLADAFVALPGGFGTLDELFEALTWAQLGFHRKAVGLLDVDGFFAPLLATIDAMVREGFVLPEQRAMVTVAKQPRELLAALERAVPLEVTKWAGAR
jgi:uncharacterized protein (TIGR00730 family)